MDKIIENIKRIVDDSSFVEISREVSDNCVIGYGTVCGKLLYVISDTGKFIDEMYLKKVKQIYELAIKTGAPIVYIIDNQGLKLDDNVKALSYYGDIIKLQTKASGIIVQIAVVSGACMGGSSVIANNCDFIFLDKNKAKLWSVLPISIKENTDDSTSQAELIQKSMMVDGIYDENELYTKVHELIDYLPSNFIDNDTYEETEDDINRQTTNINSKKIIDFVPEIADDNNVFELKKVFAEGLYTAFIKLNGQTIGVMANRCDQKHVCKSQLMKMKKFITFLDSFSIPLLTIADANSFCVKNNDDQDISLFASKAAFTFANATIPKVTLVREAVGIPGLIMGSKSLGADLVYAYKSSKMSVMDLKVEAGLIYKDEIDKSNDKLKTLDEKTKELEKSNDIIKALKDYAIDDIIDESATRQMLVSAFELLFTKREERPAKKHNSF